MTAKEILGCVIVGVLILAMLFGMSACCAKMESSTYNRLTGAQTTWWDAMWAELRVMDAPVKP